MTTFQSAPGQRQRKPSFETLPAYKGRPRRRCPDGTIEIWHPRHGWVGVQSWTPAAALND